MNIFPSTVKEIYCPPLSFPSQPDALKICGILFAHAWNIIQRWHLPQSAATTAHLSKGERNWLSLLSHHFRWKQKEPTPFSKGERTGCLLPHHFGWKKAATYASEFSHTSFERRKRKGWAYGSHHFGWKKAATKLKESKRFATPPLWCGWGGHRDSWE